MQLKTEVATIDRRRKKFRRKEREGECNLGLLPFSLRILKKIMAIKTYLVRSTAAVDSINHFSQNDVIKCFGCWQNLHWNGIKYNGILYHFNGYFYLKKSTSQNLIVHFTSSLIIKCLSLIKNNLITWLRHLLKVWLMAPFTLLYVFSYGWFWHSHSFFAINHSDCIYYFSFLQLHKP